MADRPPRSPSHKSKKKSKRSKHHKHDSGSDREPDPEGSSSAANPPPTALEVQLRDSLAPAVTIGRDHPEHNKDDHEPPARPSTALEFEHAVKVHLNLKKKLSDSTTLKGEPLGRRAREFQKANGGAAAGGGGGADERPPSRASSSSEFEAALSRHMETKKSLELSQQLDPIPSISVTNTPTPEREQADESPRFQEALDRHQQTKQFLHPARRPALRSMVEEARWGGAGGLDAIGLKHLTIRDVFDGPPGKMVSVVEGTPVSRVFALLREHRYRSCPVLTVAGMPRGFVDVWDLVMFLHRMAVEEEAKYTEEHGGHGDSTMARAALCFATNRAAFMTPVEKLLREDGKPPCMSIDELLVDVLQRMSTEQLHRVAIYEPGPRGVQWILSQSDLIRFFQHHPSLVAGALGNAVGDAMTPDGGKVSGTILQSHCVLGALSTMATHNRAALAVVDVEGRLLDTITASDFREITPESLSRILATPVDRFLESSRMLHMPHVPDTDGPDPVPSRPLTVQTCGELDQLSVVVGKMSTHHIHRVWVVDDERRPLGTISLADVLQTIARHH